MENKNKKEHRNQRNHISLPSISCFFNFKLCKNVIESGFQEEIFNMLSALRHCPKVFLGPKVFQIKIVQSQRNVCLLSTQNFQLNDTTKHNAVRSNTVNFSLISQLQQHNKKSAFNLLVSPTLIKNGSRCFSAGLAARQYQESTTSIPTSLSGSKEAVLDLIPDKPVPLESLGEAAVGFASEPTLQSLGLASWWPPGRFQYIMENIHVGLDVPWWATILIMTISVRLIVFPLVVIAQRSAAALNNVAPQTKKIQDRISEARRRGDVYEVQAASMEMQELYKKHKINPLKNFIPIMFQFPFFMSMFLGLRGMAQLPVESMTTGGLFWFENLTLADPFYVLPLLTSSTVYLQFKFAADGANLDAMGPIGRSCMNGMPVFLFCFTLNFPSAITFYWLVTNIISVTQARIVRIPLLREKLGIPKFIKWDKGAMGGPQKGLRETLRETIDNWKVTSDVADRRSYDEQTFREAGLSKVKRTYRFDPTKPQLKK